MEKRKKFTPEFKREAVRLMESSSKPAADVARELVHCHSQWMAVLSGALGFVFQTSGGLGDE
jgi:hypothetical protein